MTEDAAQRHLDDEEARCRMTAAHCERRRQQFLVELAAANKMCAEAEEALLVARQAAAKRRGKGR